MRLDYRLQYKNEKPLFIIAVVLSALLWIAVTVATFGGLLLYLLSGYVFFLFMQSAFIAHLKGSGVKISEEQYPDLYQQLVESCDKVGLTEIPEAYLLRTDFFNALATRFLGRYYVVLFTDVVDALEDQPEAIRFYIGHELGHIHRKHLLWGAFIMPAMVLPFLGAALRRAQEYTCDRYGVACCQSTDDIQTALAAIAAGDSRWKSINEKAYLKQVACTGGFWMSFNELISDYPWLTKRMATAVALSQGREIEHPGRHPLAWLLASFVARLGAGGVGSILVTIMIISVSVSLVGPKFVDYLERQRLTSAYADAYADAYAVQRRVTDYRERNGQWPESMESLGYETESLFNEEHQYHVWVYKEGLIGAYLGMTDEGKEKYLVLEPAITEGDVNWACYGENVLIEYLPENCRD